MVATRPPRTATITLATILNFAAAGLPAEKSPPPIMPDARWAVEQAHTTAYPDWLRGEPGTRPEVRSVLTSEAGDLQYWIRVPKRARGTIAVAMGESCWSEPGHRIMDILVDGRLQARGLDPIVVAGGRQRIGVVVCPAEDLDGDGLLHVEIVAAKGSPDRVTLSAGLWWFSGREITAKQAATLLRYDNDLKPDVFISHAADLSRLWEKFGQHIGTEDPKLDALVRSRGCSSAG